MKEFGRVVKEIPDNIGDGILFLDKDYKIIFTNKTILWLYREKEEAVISKECHSFSHHLRDSAGKISGCIEFVRDITGRKEVQEALRKGEEEFRLSFENAKDAIFWADTETELIIKCNKAAEALLEKKREEIVGHAQTLLHPPQKSKYYSRMFKEHIAQKGAVDSEAEVITKSGKIKPVHITASLTLIGGKQIIQGIFRDIAEQKLARKKLKESEKKYRELIANARVGVYKTDLKGDILFVNDALVKMFEFDSPEEMMSDGVLKLYKNPQDRERLIEALKKTGKADNFELEAVAKTGKIKDILLSANLEGDTMSGMIIDVTGQRRAERAVRESRMFLSSIFEGIQDGVVVLDRNFMILFANTSYIKQMGCKPEEVQCGHCYEVSYNRSEPCYVAGLECSVKNVFDTGLNSRRIRKKGGKYMEMTVYPLRDESGNILSAVEIRRDVTRAVELDGEVKKRVRELEEFYNMAVGRELKMAKLKEEIETLKDELRRYKA